jgi:phosphoribosylaminoimidazolecarboxamide formyltransferase/IMP cyclohydrolase
MSTIKTALLSVHDKSGLVEFASALHEQGVRLLSTGGTAAKIVEAGVPVTSISDYTGQAEMLEGRVKTLHPMVFGGILARREDPQQMEELEQHGIDPIDLVVVNLYPFEATVANPGHRLHEAMEQIDIGGVSLLRAAFKNAAGVVVVVDPADYAEVLSAIENDDLSLPRRLTWARRAAAHTAAYEAAICNYLNSLDVDAVGLDDTPEREPFPEALALTYRKLQGLRYGENPHQGAAFYAAGVTGARGLAAADQLHGKELSYNNILDVDAARHLAWALPQPSVAIIKHNNPCGAASASTLVEAYREARSTDPMSAFGGIVAANEEIDKETAEEIVTTFIEVVVAPGFSEEALEVLRTKKNLRLVVSQKPEGAGEAAWEQRGVDGGLLLQDRDPGGAKEWRTATDRAPDETEDQALRFAWSLIPHVRSNAIILVRGQKLVGVGAGQMSRVDSCNIAIWKARDAGHETEGCVAASDAFFPFPDGVETLAEAGVTAVVQPGGSVRDDEVTEAADRLNMAMVLTGNRHFRH